MADGEFGEGDALAYMFDGALQLGRDEVARSHVQSSWGQPLGGRSSTGAQAATRAPSAHRWWGEGVVEYGAGRAADGLMDGVDGFAFPVRRESADVDSSYFAAAASLDDETDSLPLSHLEVSAAPRADSPLYAAPTLFRCEPPAFVAVM